MRCSRSFFMRCGLVPVMMDSVTRRPNLENADVSYVALCGLAEQARLYHTAGTSLTVLQAAALLPLRGSAAAAACHQPKQCV